MADVAFIIPQKLEDLCAYSNERYVVATDYNASEVNDKIQGMSRDRLSVCSHDLLSRCEQDSRLMWWKMDRLSYWRTSTSCSGR